MTSDDIELRSLSKTFARFSDRRRVLDASPDDVARSDADAVWFEIAQQIVALRAATLFGLRLKARVVVELIEATAPSGPAIDAALSLCRDLYSPGRFN